MGELASSVESSGVLMRRRMRDWVLVSSGAIFTSWRARMWGHFQRRRQARKEGREGRGFDAVGVVVR